MQFCKFDEIRISLLDDRLRSTLNKIKETVRPSIYENDRKYNSTIANIAANKNRITNCVNLEAHDTPEKLSYVSVFFSNNINRFPLMLYIAGVLNLPVRLSHSNFVYLSIYKILKEIQKRKSGFNIINELTINPEISILNLLDFSKVLTCDEITNYLDICLALNSFDVNPDIKFTAPPELINALCETAVFNMPNIELIDNTDSTNKELFDRLACIESFARNTLFIDDKFPISGLARSIYSNTYSLEKTYSNGMLYKILYNESSNNMALLPPGFLWYNSKDSGLVVIGYNLINKHADSLSADCSALYMQ